MVSMTVMMVHMSLVTVTSDLGVTHTAAGEPEGPDGGTLDGLVLGGLRAGVGGGQRQQHLK